jgi:hypothetical protein
LRFIAGFFVFSIEGFETMALYPVPAAGYNGINQNLFPFDVSSRLFREWVQITPLYNLMGNEPTRPIVRKQLGKGEGLQYRMGKLQALDYKNPITNFDQRRGNAQQQQVDYDKVDVDFKSFLVQIKGYDILNYGTPIELPPYARSQLVEAFSRALNRDLFLAATIGMYPNMINGGANCNVADTIPSYDRIVLAGLAPNLGQYYANAAFPTLFNAVVATPAANGLSALHLKNLKLYAERGGSAINREDALQPAFVRSKSGWPMNKYIYLAHPESLTSIFADPLFTNSTFYRGTVIDQDNTPQTLNGADYVGEFFGISLYSCRDLYEFEFLSTANNHRMAWNLFIGAGAWSLGWAEEPMLGMENDLVERIQLYFGHEFRGQKMLKFKSYMNAANAGVNLATTVEQGILHSFIALT